MTPLRAPCQEVMQIMISIGSRRQKKGNNENAEIEDTNEPW